MTALLPLSRPETGPSPRVLRVIASVSVVAAIALVFPATSAWSEMARARDERARLETVLAAERLTMSSETILAPIRRADLDAQLATSGATIEQRRALLAELDAATALLREAHAAWFSGDEAAYNDLANRANSLADALNIRLQQVGPVGVRVLDQRLALVSGPRKSSPKTTTTTTPKKKPPKSGGGGGGGGQPEPEPPSEPAPTSPPPSTPGPRLPPG